MGSSLLATRTTWHFWPPLMKNSLTARARSK